jgi:hypothetical protein
MLVAKSKYMSPKTDCQGKKMCGEVFTTLNSTSADGGPRLRVCARLREKYVARKRRQKNNTKYSGHFVPQQGPRAAHELRLDQFMLTFKTMTVD